MYQQSTHFDLSYLDNPEETFTAFINDFKGLAEVPALGSDNSKFDLDVVYLVTWACIWNKPTSVNRSCVITQKTNEYALVMFLPEPGQPQVEADSNISVDKIFRLYDLEPTDVSVLSILANHKNNEDKSPKEH